MSTQVEKTIEVDVPLSTAYNQWTQFEDFPQFMGGITSVTQLGDNLTEWVAEIAGVRRRWQARITEQVPDSKVAWAATEGATNAGSVTFAPAGAGRTQVTLWLDYEPEGLVEKIGDKLNVVENQAEGDLKRFKKFIEAEGYESGAWRGTVTDQPGTPVAGDAASSVGDSGKAGVTGAAVAAGVVAAAAAAVGVGAAVAAGKKSDDETEVETYDTVETVPVVETAPVVDTYAADPIAGDPVVADPYVADPIDTDPLTARRDDDLR